MIAGESRGWVYGGSINYAYQNNYVPLLTYGSIIGIGVLASRQEMVALYAQP